ncbi:PD-(D/E)XK motif protein [uncultured Roseobacter sp.]|uniref:PD-(D/E)XK motif protein n=1 Tax=uncultured Roseobacter sp. TaxID=114847 RepID=UPI00261CD4AC|nr:PD-(D/E)XK motif protein [uncultured Roseobacter sp.]
MKNEDPWYGIAPPPSDQAFSGRLAHDCRPHELFRGLDHLGRRALFLVHEKSLASKARLPDMAGLIVENREQRDDERLLISVTLESDENADIFSKLSEDIVDVVSGASDESAAVSAFIERTWKWHDLLKGKRKPKLSREAQMGLIGELWTLMHLIAPVVGIGTAVAGWKGAEQAPKDFELSGVCIECKSRGAASRTRIRISSEYQLEDVPSHALVLLVLTFATCDDREPLALTLHGIVGTVRSELSKMAPQLVSTLDQGLDDAGYDTSHEYDLVIRHRSTAPYEVQGTFPRIVPASIPDGPVEIGYDLPLEKLEKFHIEQQTLIEMLKRGSDDNVEDR